MNERQIITVVSVLIAFGALCILLFWSNIGSFIAERRERRKAKEWELRSKSR